MRRAVLLLLAGVARARMPASWYAYGDAAPAGGGGLGATGGDGCWVTIDTSRTQEWNGGFQIYIVVGHVATGAAAKGGSLEELGVQLKHRAEQELRKEPFVAVGVLGVAALCCSCFARRYVFRRRYKAAQTDEFGKEGRRRGRRDRRSVELLRVPRRR